MEQLLDENLSWQIVPFIQNSYPGSTQVALIGLERVIRQYAIDNGYITTQDCLAQDRQSIESGDYQNLARQSASH